mmetsp:Transcript_47094/g.112918  ORF Transcript_47094/g.112918 Transcript_47094/m.112918 type:complete len:138 (-) Transcript_47094:175-588(-)
MMVSLSARLGSAADASAALGITVESVPTLRAVLADLDGSSISTEEKGAMALLALLVLLPPMLCMVYVAIQYSGKECKYLSYRFSHTNPFIVIGYMPKERREALWAEIKAPKESKFARTQSTEAVLAEADRRSKAESI